MLPSPLLLIDLFPDYALILDEQGSILAANERLARALGMSPSALSGRSFYAITKSPEAVRRYLKQASGSKEPLPGSISFNTASAAELELRVDACGIAENGAGSSWIFLRCRPKPAASISFLLLNEKIAELTREIEERRELEERLRESEARFRTLADNIPALCWMANGDGWIFWYNSRWYEYTGTTPNEMEGWGWQAVHDPDVLPTVMDNWKKSIMSGNAFEMVFPLRGADGKYRPFLTRVVPLRNEYGRIVRWFGTNTDVTAQQRDQQHLQLLIDELNHRVKNTLATVQSLTAQTLRGSSIEKDVKRAVEDRLLALSATHSLLTTKMWRSASLADLVTIAFKPFVAPEDQGRRIISGGPAVELRPNAALALGMALNELIVNALKHGALSRDSGAVELRWDVTASTADPRLEFEWRERGGPPVKQPDRLGFGTRLLTKGIPHELGGEVDLRFESQGVVCLIAIPTAELQT